MKIIKAIFGRLFGKSEPVGLSQITARIEKDISDLQSRIEFDENQIVEKEAERQRLENEKVKLENDISRAKRIKERFSDAIA